MSFFKKLRHGFSKLSHSKLIRRVVGRVAPHLIGMVPGGSVALKARAALMKHRGSIRRLRGAVHTVHHVSTIVAKTRAMRHSHVVHPPHIQSHVNRRLNQMHPNPFINGRYNLTHMRRLMIFGRLFPPGRGKRYIAARARHLKAV